MRNHRHDPEVAWASRSLEVASIGRSLGEKESPTGSQSWSVSQQREARKRQSAVLAQAVGGLGGARADEAET